MAKSEEASYGSQDTRHSVGGTPRVEIAAGGDRVPRRGASGSATMGRPSCAVLPEALQAGRTATSFGCIANRVYTGLGDDEGYYAMPGAKVADVVSKLAVIVEANRQLEAFHKSRAVR